jgi:hypothetical protein
VLNLPLDGPRVREVYRLPTRVDDERIGALGVSCLNACRQDSLEQKQELVGGRNHLAELCSETLDSRLRGGVGGQVMLVEHFRLRGERLLKLAEGL